MRNLCLAKISKVSFYVFIRSFIVVYGTRYDLKLFLCVFIFLLLLVLSQHMDIQSSQHLIEKLILSSLNCLFAFVEN